MSPLWLVPLGYVACSYAAYRILIANWTRTLDYKKSHVVGFLLMSSMGPLSLAISCLVWMIGLDPEGPKDRILVKRKDRQS